MAHFFKITADLKTEFSKLTTYNLQCEILLSHSKSAHSFPTYLPSVLMCLPVLSTVKSMEGADIQANSFVPSPRLHM